MTPQESPKEKRRDKIWRANRDPAQIRADAEQTIKRILTAMSMTQNVQLADFIGCHKGDISRWLRIGVPLDFIEFISCESGVGFEYLRYGKNPEFKANADTFSGFKTRVSQKLKAAQELRMLKQTTKEGFDQVATTIAMDLVDYLNTSHL